ncbi:MAG: hypothetical protein ACM359_23210 [Bacillota bacterium]
MFYLASMEFPTTAQELARALASTLHELFVIPPGREPAQIHGDFPALESIQIDLNNAAVRTGQTPPRPIGAGQVRPGPTVQRLAVEGRPVFVEAAALHFALTAEQVHLNFDRDSLGRPLMLLDQARNGHVQVQISRQDIQSLLLAGIGAKAAAHGLAITNVELALTQLNPRAVAVEMRISAKKFVTAVIGIRGQLHIDDELRAQLRELSCHGDGMIGKMVCGLLNPHLQKLDRRELPLMAFSLGQVRLRDVQLDTRNGLDITARFGS